MSEIISVKNLSHSYTDGASYKTDAIKNISFSINKGEIIGIVGHTGSGKSTLIQHLNGLIKTDKGHIFIDGEDIWENPKEITKVRHKVGLVFQYPEYQLFEETAYKDIAYGPTNMGLSSSEIDSRVRLAAQMVGVTTDMLNESPFDFSGGEKRRVAIAGVIAMQPQVLIMDELSAGLDPKGRKLIFDLIKNYRDKTGSTVIVVSHNMDDIAACADRIIVMNRGELVMFDTPENVFYDSTMLASLSLDFPSAARIAEKLRGKGVNLPKGILTMEQLVNCISAINKGGAK